VAGDQASNGLARLHCRQYVLTPPPKRGVAGRRARRSVAAASVATLLLLGAPTLGPRTSAVLAAAQIPFGVNVSSATFVDATRGTPARIGVPAKPTRTIHEAIYDPIGAPGALPTVVFAPGWDSQSSAYDPLLRAIASAGFLVVGVDSPGSSSYFPGSPYWSIAGEDISNNTVDLSAALINLETGPFGPQVDTAAVAAVGHSNGGSEVANLALNRAYVSARFNAYVVLSGIVPLGQVPGSFGAVNNGPILAAVGTADEYGNYSPGGSGTEAVYGVARSSKIMVTIGGATHLSAFIGSGPQPDDTRSAIVDFLSVAERHDPGARASFNAEVHADGLSTTAVLNPGWYAGPTVVGMASTADGRGYWIASSNGTVRNFGDAPAWGGYLAPNLSISAIAPSPDRRGYWLVERNGNVHGFGDAVNHGGANQFRLNAPIVAMADDPATGGYWLLGGDGGVFSFDAPFYGSTGNIRLDAPAVGMVSTADGKGYYFVASDGGVFSYGDARFHGSMGGQRLNQPMVGMALDPTTHGYWLDASDGGVFAFAAPFRGSTGNIRLSQPCVAMVADPTSSGYWLVAADGGVFSFDAPFEGSGA
jgi:dienelactone hydrolase